jgi:SAM-dependent methyltransferase
MDKQTIIYYSKNAYEYYKETSSVTPPLKTFFDSLWTKPTKILDIGAGAARDMLYLLERGHDVYGIEPSNALREFAIYKNPVLDGRYKSGQLPIEINPFDFKFGGIILSAVLMHIPQTEIDRTNKSVSKIMGLDAKIIISIPSVRNGLDAKNRDEYGRLYTPIDEEFLSSTLNNNGIYITKVTESIDIFRRPGISWKIFTGIRKEILKLS